MLDQETLPLEAAPFLDISDPNYSDQVARGSGGPRTKLVCPHTLWFGGIAL